MRRYRWLVVHPKARKPFRKLKILNSFESIEYIIKHCSSVSRYGDGEIGLLLEKALAFKVQTKTLANVSNKCFKPMTRQIML